tara:strand:- start:845 stop:1966 length:1122 start_codon:yes stop_codon:yes gene_type:complete
MRVILFFTYGNSLLQWKESGLLDREIKLYKRLNQDYGLNFTFVTYGNETDFGILDELSYINVLPVYETLKYDKSKFFRFLRSFFIVSKIKYKLEDADILKTNQLLGSWVAIIAKYVLNKPLIVRTGYDLLTFSKKNKKSKIKIFFYYLLTKISVHFSDRYIVSSIVDYEYIKHIHYKHYKKLEVIRNWVDESKVPEFTKRYTNQIISVGRLEDQKNYKLLIEKFIGSELSIDLYGEGSLKEDLIQYAKKNKVTLNINYPVPNKELLKTLGKYKIFISTSSFEGSPKAILEAMSCGCVVFAVKNENVSEIIKNKENGFIFEKDDDLLESVYNIINNENEWSRISSNAVDTVSTTFTLQGVLEKEFSIYKDLDLS